MTAFYIIYPDEKKPMCMNNVPGQISMECLYPRDSPYDLEFVILDRSFKPVNPGSTGADFCQCYGTFAGWEPEYYGAVPTVNGKIAPLVGRFNHEDARHVAPLSALVSKHGHSKGGIKLI